MPRILSESKPARVIPSVAAGLGLLALGVALSLSGSAVATGGSLTPFQDADGDGLDDALEVRLGLSPTAADADADGLSDLQEILLSTDPLLYTNAGDWPTPSPTLYLSSYLCGQDYVMELYALRESTVDNVSFTVGTETSVKTYSVAEVLPYMHDFTTFSTPFAGWEIDRLRVHSTRAWLTNLGPVSFAVQATLDGQERADVISITPVGASLAEWVEIPDTNASAPRSSSLGEASWGPSGSIVENGGGGVGGAENPTGGLIPVDPGEGAPPGAADQICIQVLGLSAVLGNGRMSYEVVDAYCDPSPGSICMTDCALSVGDSIIIIDIPGVIGG